MTVMAVISTALHSDGTARHCRGVVNARTARPRLCRGVVNTRESIAVFACSLSASVQSGPRHE
jgi:hypothetical protein